MTECPSVWKWITTAACMCPVSFPAFEATCPADLNKMGNELVQSDSLKLKWVLMISLAGSRWATDIQNRTYDKQMCRNITSLTAVFNIKSSKNSQIRTAIWWKMYTAGQTLGIFFLFFMKEDSSSNWGCIYLIKKYSKNCEIFLQFKIAVFHVNIC